MIWKLVKLLTNFLNFLLWLTESISLLLLYGYSMWLQYPPPITHKLMVEVVVQLWAWSWILKTHVWKWFLRVSVICNVPRMGWTMILLVATDSHTKWMSNSMCFILAWRTWLCDTMTALMSSHINFGTWNSTWVPWVEIQSIETQKWFGQWHNIFPEWLNVLPLIAFWSSMRRGLVQESCTCARCFVNMSYVKL